MVRFLAVLGLSLSVVVPTASADVGGFRGNDGDQACTAPGELDWACLPASAGLAHGADATGADDIVFIGGKEDEPRIWDLAAGGTNGKTDLLNVWTAGQETDTQSFLQLGFHRLTGEGDVFLSFELNQSRAVWTNPLGDGVPCRTDGDVLISYEGSGVIVPALYRWSGSDGPAACPDGGVGDWFTGSGPSADAEGRTNGTAITNALPGPATGTTLDVATFGEASLDLGSVARRVGISKPCEFFTSMLAHSRSSSSFSSSMGDFVASQEISLAACGGPNDPGDTTPPDPPSLSASTGCHEDGTITLGGTAEPGSQVQVREGTTTRGLATARVDGTWSVLVSGVPTGSHAYTARARDAAGNVSGDAPAVSVDVDATPPAIAITATGATPGFAYLGGTSEPGATITVREGGHTVGQTVANASGEWAIAIAAGAGAHTYTAEATDACATSDPVTATVTVRPRTATPGGDTPSGGNPGGPGGPGGTTTAPPTGEVLGETAGCTGKRFKVFISDPGIKRVTFKVDKRTVVIVRKRDSKKRFTATIDPNRFGAGTHRISAVLLKRNGRKRTVPMRSFKTCDRGKCVSRRAFKIRVKRVSGDTVVRATVYVNNKRVKVVRGKRLRAAVVLTGLPKGTFTVKIRSLTASGKTVDDQRRYRTCAKKRKKRS